MPSLIALPGVINQLLLLVPHSDIAHVRTRRAKALITLLEPTQGEALAP